MRVRPKPPSSHFQKRRFLGTGIVISKDDEYLRIFLAEPLSDTVESSGQKVLDEIIGTRILSNSGKRQVRKEISAEENARRLLVFDDVKKFSVATHVTVEIGNEKATFHDAFSTIGPENGLLLFQLILKKKPVGEIGTVKIDLVGQFEQRVHGNQWESEVNRIHSCLAGRHGKLLGG